MPYSTQIGVRHAGREESHTAQESDPNDLACILFPPLESADFFHVKLHGTR